MSSNDISDLFPPEEFEEVVEVYTPKEEEKTVTSKKDENNSEENREFTQWQKDLAEKKKKAYQKIEAMALRVFNDKTALIDYLTVQANFNRYSVGNALLIAEQDAGATKLRSFADWEADGFRIKKGCKGTLILEPGGEYTKTDGSTGRYMNVRTLFDCSKVLGPFQPQKPEKSNRDKTAALIYNMSSMIKSVAGERENILNGRAALYHEQIIYVNRQAPFEVLYPHIAVELAHARCSVRFPEDYSRELYGPICEMAGYIICKHAHVSVGDTVIPLRFPKEYKDYDKDEVCDILSLVRDTANSVIQNIFKGYEEIDKSKAQPNMSK